MQLLILLFTVGSFTVFILIAGLALRNKTKSRSKYLLIAMSLSLAAGLLMGIPSEWGNSHALRLLFRFFDLPSTGLIWWFVLSLLDDDFKLGRLSWAGMIAVLIPSTIFWLEDIGFRGFLFPGVHYLNPLVFTILLLHILWIGLLGRKDDLINKRREVRIWIVVLLTFAASASIIAGYTLDGNQEKLLRGVIIFPSVVLVLFWLTRFEVNTITFTETSSPQISTLDIDPKDTIAHDRLIYLMQIEKIYLDPDISVALLAERVGIPSHQLRNLINNGLKFRNFTSFLASYRIPHAKHVLADPKKMRVPILTIAMDAGFSSLTTFNRTFKNEVGQTAGEFRQKILDAHAQI